MTFIDAIHTNVLSPQTNAASPPPINWSTKPNRNWQDTRTLDGSEGLSIDTPPADSVTDESDEHHQLALLLRHLGHAVGVVDATSQQDGRDSRGVQSSNTVSSSMHEVEAALHQLESKDGLHTCENETSDFLNLTAAVSHLSTLDAPVVLEPCAPLGFLSHFLASPHPNGKKYYVILKGICTGIYHGEWYVFTLESSSASSIIPCSFRDDVRCLVERVPGAGHKSFKTLESANAFYLHAKNKGKVCSIRNPGDAARYGPDEDAVQ